MTSCRIRSLGFVLAALLLVLVAPVAAVRSQDATSAATIYLQARTFDPFQDQSAAGASAAAVELNADGLGYFLVQFHGPVERSWVAGAQARQ